MSISFHRLRAPTIKIGKGEPELSPALLDADAERAYCHVFAEDFAQFDGYFGDIE